MLDGRQVPIIGATRHHSRSDLKCDERSEAVPNGILQSELDEPLPDSIGSPGEVFNGQRELSTEQPLERSWLPSGTLKDYAETAGHSLNVAPTLSN